MMKETEDAHTNGTILCVYGLEELVLNMIPKAQALRINKWNYIKLKSFCTMKKPSVKEKGSLLNGRIFGK